MFSWWHTCNMVFYYELTIQFINLTSEGRGYNIAMTKILFGLWWFFCCCISSFKISFSSNMSLTNIICFYLREIIDVFRSRKLKLLCVFFSDLPFSIKGELDAYFLKWRQEGLSSLVQLLKMSCTWFSGF